MIDFTSVVQAISVSEQLSFRRAAVVLGAPQSVVSRRVRNLEDELGVSLFERHSGGVRTTAAGRVFFARAKKAIVDLDYAVKSAGSAGRGAEGHLRVGIFASIASGFSRDLLAAYTADHPSVAIDVAECAPREQMARLKERRLDVAFLTGLPVAPGLDVELLWHERVFVVLPAAHRSLATAVCYGPCSRTSILSSVPTNLALRSTTSSSSSCRSSAISRPLSGTMSGAKHS